MKWIVISILVFIVGYTFITIHYRKPGAAHQPYKDAKDRATVQRLQEAGYQRIAATISLPADPKSSAARLGKTFATHQVIPGGIPAELAETLIDKPALPESFSSVAAPAEVASLMPYVFLFTCTLPDKKSTVEETYVYLKNNDVAVVASFEKIGGELEARSRENPVLVTIPGGTLKPGTYQVRLIGAQNSRQWTLQVK
jgi:hypothetical protein